MAEFEEESEPEEISTEEKLQITKHYLLSSPPGQFREVLADVRKIIPADLLSDEMAGDIARVSNLRNGKVVVTPSGNKAVLTAAGEVDVTRYVDPKTGAVFSVDHLTLSTSEDAATVANDNEGQELQRAALQSAAEKYVLSNYPSEYSAAGAYAKDDGFSIVISGEKINLRNFWSGRWTSSWTLQAKDGAATLSGDIKLHVHYYEDGNLQLQTAKEVPPASLSYYSEADLAEKVIEMIKSQESQLQSGLEDMYTNMNRETFRSMRRGMPITQTKMEWNVNAVRMVKQVRK
mmetsp:Transcript_3644/g.7888  ORF Transcript_3644/g.7888 Transcript_3644/m.7888 type:complete len:290 (-) Transcript_3644:205-1074(-)